MVSGSPRNHIRSRSTIGIGALLCLTLGMTACGTPTGTAVAALIPPTATPTATATPAPTATATPIPPTATATAVPTATSTASPILTPTRAATATVVPIPRATTPAAATPVGGYRANWRTWVTGEDSTLKLRRTYEAANDEYRIAVLDEGQEWSLYAPEAQKFQDFVLEVEGRRVAGPDNVGYGLVFRRQPKQGDGQSERYIFYVTAQGRFTFYQVTADNKSRVLRPLDAAGAGVIKVGDEPNRLRVTARGGQLELAINGTSVFTTTNAAITQAGEIGIFAKSPDGDFTTEVALKDLQLRPNP